jgi:hypothetical protein
MRTPIRSTLSPAALAGFRAAIVFIAVVPAVSSPAPAQSVSYRNDVMAVLSKAGCNQGTCHGNQNGKNGFKLSLRGEDPLWDLDALTRDGLGRRVEPGSPDASLVLLKATAGIPHEGGRRFDKASSDYALLRQWIADGARDDPPNSPVLQRIEIEPGGQILVEAPHQVQLHVRAYFTDGRVRDVTRFCVYETSNQAVTVNGDGEVRTADDRRLVATESAILVRYLNRQATAEVAFIPDGKHFHWTDVPKFNFIDRNIFAKLKALRMQPSSLCSDSVFLRRAYFDLLGIPPTTEEARAFLSDGRADKRARLADALLERPEFADFWALKWSDLLRNEEKLLDRKGVEVFHRWIRQCIAEGKPLNEFARELLAGRGSTYADPPANFYRALRDPYGRAEAVAQVFLGIRMQCAKCHNHPFERWTQNDYHGLAAFFARVQYRIVENKRRDGFDQHEFIGEQIVYPARTGEVRHPRTGEVVPPRFLGADTAAPKPDADRLQMLADWVADPANPFFARAQVNRIWHHLMGRGIVDPLDDFRASNPPVNAPLLDALAQEFVSHGFELRRLIRTIMNSRTYQLAAAPNDTNREDETNFSHALVRPLQAEQLLDAVARATDVPVAFPGYPRGFRAAQLPGVRPERQRDRRPSEGETFLKVFGKPDRLLTCECERSDDTTLNQAFQLVTGELMNAVLADSDNRIGRLLNSGKSDREILAELYLAALSRAPTSREAEANLQLLERSKNRREMLEDILWGLLNAKEFLLRQ